MTLFSKTYKEVGLSDFGSHLCLVLTSMRNVLIDRLRKNYKLPSNIDLPSTPFPLKRSKGSKVPGSNFKQKTTLFSSIPDVPERDKKILSLPETKVETKIIKNYTKQPKQMNKKVTLMVVQN